MRDRSKNRKGFDRVLMAVAATFLTVSATSALAPVRCRPRTSAAELAIDAAIPRPNPPTSRRRPPAISRLDTTATVPMPPEAAKDGRTRPSRRTTAKAAEPQLELKPAEIVTAPPNRNRRNTEERHRDHHAAAAPATASAGRRAGKGRKQRAAADQPVADKLREMLAGKIGALLSTARASAPRSRSSTARANMRRNGRKPAIDRSAKGVIARLKDAAAEGLNPADYPVPDFAAATSPDQLADAELKLTASMLDYARQAQSGRMHWSQVSGDILYPEHPIDPAEVLTNISTAKDASAALDGYNPPHKLYAN